MKRTSPLARMLRTLPPGRRRVAKALLAHSGSRTYAAVATQLGIHLGTVHQHLRRIRLRHPQVYVMVTGEAKGATRHAVALERACDAGYLLRPKQGPESVSAQPVHVLEADDR